MDDKETFVNLLKMLYKKELDEKLLFGLIFEQN